MLGRMHRPTCIGARHQKGNHDGHAPFRTGDTLGVQLRFVHTSESKIGNHGLRGTGASQVRFEGDRQHRESCRQRHAGEWEGA